MNHDVPELAAALGERAEDLCRRYLPRGQRCGRYWIVGDPHGAPGRSMWVRLAPPGRMGTWTDGATGEHGDLLDLIRIRLGADSLGPALEEARAVLSLPAPVHASHPSPVAPMGARSESARTAAAGRLWDACRPPGGTHAEAYLRARGIEPRGWTALRFHPALFYRSETRSCALPALVAAVTTNAGALAGVHRTWLDSARPGKAGVTAPKKALGPIFGHAVRFKGAPASALLVVGEGIETVLSVLTALPEFHGAAALSAPGLGSFTPPLGFERLLIARDNDRAGEHAARRLGHRCRVLGIDTEVLVPTGADFNDDLVSLGPAELAKRIAQRLGSNARTRAAAPRPSNRERTEGNGQDEAAFERAPRQDPPPQEPVHPARNHPMANTTTSPAHVPTYIRLRSGEWGVRVPEQAFRLALGETARLQVHRRSGEVRNETVRCFWLDVEPRTGEAVALCELVRFGSGRREDGPESP